MALGQVVGPDQQFWVTDTTRFLLIPLRKFLLLSLGFSALLEVFHLSVGGFGLLTFFLIDLIYLATVSMLP